MSPEGALSDISKAQAQEAVKEAKAKLALEAAERACARARERLRAVEEAERVRVAAVVGGSSSSFAARGGGSGGVLNLSYLALTALVLTLYVVFVCYMLCWGGVQGDVVVSAFVKRWCIMQAIQQGVITALVPLLGSLWVFVLSPALRRALGACAGGGGGTTPPPTLPKIRVDPAAEKARNKLMTQASSVAADLPPSFAVIAYGLALAAGGLGSRAATAIKFAIKDRGEAALEEKVEEAEKAAEEAEEEAAAAAAEEEEAAALSLRARASRGAACASTWD